MGKKEDHPYTSRFLTSIVLSFSIFTTPSIPIANHTSSHVPAREILFSHSKQTSNARAFDLLLSQQLSTVDHNISSAASHAITSPSIPTRTPKTTWVFSYRTKITRLPNCLTAFTTLEAVPSLELNLQDRFAVYGISVSSPALEAD